MRHHQAGFVDHGVAVQNQIQIKRPWCTRVGSYPPETTFDVQECLEEGPRGQRGSADRGGIQEAGLLADADRFGIVERGRTQVANN